MNCDFKIWCGNFDVYQQVLKKAQNEGYLWVSGSPLPIDRFPNGFTHEVGLFFSEKSKEIAALSRTYFDTCNSIQTVDWKDYVMQKLISIYKQGSEIIAVDHNTNSEKRICVDKEHMVAYIKQSRNLLRQIAKDYMLNTKICIASLDTYGLTVGKIYSIKNGRLYDDDSDMHPSNYPFCSLEEVERYFNSGKKYRPDEPSVEFVVVVE